MSADGFGRRTIAAKSEVVFDPYGRAIQEFSRPEPLNFRAFDALVSPFSSGQGLAPIRSAPEAGGTPILSGSGVWIIEGNSSSSQLVFTLTLDEAPTAPVTVYYYLQDGTASVALGDYRGFYSDSEGSVTFATGETSKTISVYVYGDTAVESDETFRLLLTNLSGGNAKFANDASALGIRGMIVNDDGGVGTGSAGSINYYNGPSSAHASLPTLTISDVAQYEGNGSSQYVRFLITLDKAPTTDVSFAYYFQDGTASVAADDYRGFYSSSEGTITIPAGHTSTWVEGYIYGETAVEANETFSIVLVRATGAVFQGNAPALRATATIINDDGGAPTITGGIGGNATGISGPASAHASLPTLTVHNVAQFEGNGSSQYVRFLVTLDKAPTTNVTLSYYFQDGSASVAAGDYRGFYSDSEGSVTILAGQTSTWIEAYIYGDVAIETNETFNVVLTSISGAVFQGGAPSLTATATIIENDGGAPNMSAGIGAPATPFTPAPPAHPSLPTIRVSNVSQFEGNSSSETVRFLVTLDKAPTTNVTFWYYFQDGTASVAAGDYRGIFSDSEGTVVIQAGQTSTWVEAYIYGDTNIEVNETFQLVLVNPQGAVFEDGAPALIATGTVIDNDGGAPNPSTAGVGIPGVSLAGPASSHASLPTVTVHNVAQYEGNSSSEYVRFLITLDKAPTAPVTFNYLLQDGTASSALGDYAGGSGTVTISAGQVSTWIEVPIYGDANIEPNETFQLILSNISGGVFSGVAPVLVATATIIENDAGAPTADGGLGNVGQRVIAAPDINTLPTLRVVSTSVNEGDGNNVTAGVYLVLSRPSNAAITLSYQTIAGTAQSGTPADFTALSGSGTIPAGSTSVFIPITVRGDTLIEGDESFTVQITNLVGAVFEGGGVSASATVLIRDDESGTAGAQSGPNFAFSPQGTSGNDVLNGTASNEALYGLAGNDTLNGRAGSDILDGGPGTDAVTYADAAAAVTVSLAIVGQQNTGGSGLDSIAGVENLIGSAFNDSFIGNTLANRLDGGNGNDSLDGGAGNDTLLGGAGDDLLNGGDGADSMEGGAGGDIYYVNNAGDIVVEGAVAGIDVVRTSITYELGANVEGLTIVGAGARNGTGNALANTLTGNDAANKLRGLDGNDTLNGGAGNDTVEGGAGVDFLRGEAGDDTYDVDNADDFVRELEGGGVDTVRTSVTRALDPNAENLIITGSAARNGSGNSQDNQVTGNGAANILAGRLGNDTVIGGGGNDKINGGEGIDVLTGGTGQDAFVFDAAAIAGNADTITDFSVADDTIQLDNAIFTALGADGALNAGFFRVGSAPADANDFLYYNAATGALYYDSNGNAAGGAVRIATLSTGLALTAADFLVI